jgi:hypothetical protein
MIKRFAALLVILIFASHNRAAEPITGVAPAALDQPRVYLQIARAVKGPALVARANDQKTSAVEAFLDTGASGIVLASNTATALGIKAEQSASRSPVSYEDVGVAGTEKFAVSEPLFLSLADYSSDIDGDTASYGKPIGPFLFQLKPNGDQLDAFTGGTDIVGMPAMQNRVIVMDPRGLAKLDKIKTSLLPPGDRAIPRVSRTVPLTYVSFARFGRIMPAGSPRPASTANPMIGPDPFQPTDRASPVRVAYHGKSATLTMLLDTGSACSIISTEKAKQLGVTYADDGSTLLGVAKSEQFSLPVGGIGGIKTSTGFYLDLLMLPAKTGDPIIYAKAPLLVSDITVVDSKTQKSFTLDGVFGMNFLVASASLTAGALPDIDKVVAGPFEMIVIDHSRHTLGVK